MNNLVVLLGPTGVGKTELSLQMAEQLSAPILSADSRQIYREIPICSAAATADQQARVRHYFVGTHSLDQSYSAAQFEADALAVINPNPNLNPNPNSNLNSNPNSNLSPLTSNLSPLTSNLSPLTSNLSPLTSNLSPLTSNLSPLNYILCGGSMLYLDAVCKGIDDMPQADPAIRARLNQQAAEEGLAPLLEQLERLDPVYFAQVDRKNPLRVIHGLEMCLTTGLPFSSFRSGKQKERPFRIIKIGLKRSREELYERIERRVGQMLSEGLIEETLSVYRQYEEALHTQLSGVIRNPGPTQAQPIPNLFPTSLNTVGLKEMLLYHEGIYTLDRATDRIVHNSKVYSKKQMTWFQRDESIQWFAADAVEEILDFIGQNICSTT